MARSPFTVPLLAVLLCLPPAVGAGEAAVAPTAEPLPEILVEGTRLWNLRKALVEADDRFFARYNEINKDHDFDVHCTLEAPLGTRLKQRACRPAFQERADFEWARSILQGTAATPPLVVWLDRQDAYRRNLADVARSDPQLLKMLREREALEKKYQEELGKRMKGRWIVFD